MGTGVDRRYLYTAVVIHWFIWGFVAMDRLVITYVAPSMAKDLHFSLTDLGMIFGVLGVSWGTFSFFAGGILSDKVGKKKIIVPATLIFSVLSWVTGAVSCFAQLLVVRGIMGAAEGSYLAPATATLSELAGDKRRGWIVGLHQSAYPLWGGLFAAIYVRQVVTTLDWRWVFYLTLIPGLVLAVVHWRFIKEPPSVVQRSQVPHSEKISWTEPFRNRNIVLTTIIMLLFMAWTNVFIAFGTIYLTQARQLTLGLAVTIVSAWGIGAFLGMPVLSAISDRVGRRPTLVIGCLGAGVFTILYATAGGTSASITVLYIFMLFAGFFGQGIYPLFSAIIPSESVDVKIVATAISIPTALGEIFGGFAPAIAGLVAQHLGLVVVFIGAGTALVVASGLACGVMETLKLKGKVGVGQ